MTVIVATLQMTLLPISNLILKKLAFNLLLSWLNIPAPFQEHYESPLVAVKFKNPAQGQLLHVECRAWAKNIKYNKMDRIGMTHFELFILDNDMAETYEDSFK